MRPSRKPRSRREDLNTRLGKQTILVKGAEKNRAKAEELLDDWRENAWERIQDVCNVGFPAEVPSDPTSAGIILGRLQGFLWPLRTAMDTVEIHDQMKSGLEKTREQLEDLEELDLED